MGVIGKGSSSFRKKDVMEQKGIALGFKKIRFAHKATAGDTGINMNALVQPSEMAAYGFTNPTATSIAGANIYTYRSNLKLVSSLKGLLIDQLSYTVNSSTQINFIDFTAEDGEIFTGWIDDSPTTSLSVVDGNQIVASGILLAGQTDFNIGTPIQINKNSASQIGAVMVFADRGLQYRKVGNITTGDGDYIEVAVAGGLGSLIRFNASGSDRFITVVSNGVVAERPDGSMMAAIERTQGQIDAMVPYLAAATGQPTTTFQTGPNNVDLKQFGDLVLSQQVTINKLLTAAVPITTPWADFPSNAAGIFLTAVTSNPTYGNVLKNKAQWRRNGENMEIRWDFLQNSAGSAGSGNYLINIPSAIGTIDTNKIVPTTGDGTADVGTFFSFSNNHGPVYVYSSSQIGMIAVTAPGSSGTAVGSGYSQLSNSNQYYSVIASVPILGWTATQTLAQQLGL